MLFCAISFGDRESCHSWRQQKAKHFEYWRQHRALRLAGPFFDEDHRTKIGCLIIIQADSRQEAENIFHQDPLYRCGVFKSCEIHPWQALSPSPNLSPKLSPSSSLGSNSFRSGRPLLNA